jgi:hypothetical protein
VVWTFFRTRSPASGPLGCTEKLIVNPNTLDANMTKTWCSSVTTQVLERREEADYSTRLSIAMATPLQDLSHLQNRHHRLVTGNSTPVSDISLWLRALQKVDIQHCKWTSCQLNFTAFIHSPESFDIEQFAGNDMDFMYVKNGGRWHSLHVLLDIVQVQSVVRSF